MEVEFANLAENRVRAKMSPQANDATRFRTCQNPLNFRKSLATSLRPPERPLSGGEFFVLF